GHRDIAILGPADDAPGRLLENIFLLREITLDDGERDPRGLHTHGPFKKRSPRLPRRSDTRDAVAAMPGTPLAEAPGAKNQPPHRVGSARSRKPHGSWTPTLFSKDATSRTDWRLSFSRGFAKNPDRDTWRKIRSAGGSRVSRLPA